MGIGDIVEWKPWFVPGVSRGRVSRIDADGTVWVTMKCRRRYRGEDTWYDSDVSFEPSQVCRLAIVGQVDQAALATLAHNIAIAGALRLAANLEWAIGYNAGFSDGRKVGRCEVLP